MSREIDKKIAELKGNCYHEGTRGGFSCDHCGIKNIDAVWRLNKKYSTNISDAWELWEELPRPKQIYAPYDKRPNVAYLIQCYKEIETKAETFPLAVCKAWIAYKEKKWKERDGY